MEGEELPLDIERANAEDNKKLTLALMKCIKVCDEVEEMENVAKLFAQYDSDGCDSTMEDILEYNSIREDLIQLETLKCMEETRKRIANRNSYLKRWKEIARDKRGKKGTFRRFKSRERRPNSKLKSLRECYLNSIPTLSKASFIRKFRIPRETYRQIRMDILTYEKTMSRKEQFFLQRRDASGEKGINSHLKLLAALEFLGHNVTFADLEASYGISQENIRLSCNMLCRRLIKLYAKDFLRLPTRNEAKKILEMNYAKCGLPFYLGSVDCAHIVRINGNNELRGDNSRKPTMKIEAMVDENRYFWHMSVGDVGSANDISTRYDSTLESEMRVYDTLSCNVGGMNLHGTPFLLVNQTYPDQRHLLKSYNEPTKSRHYTFNRLHSGARKAIEVAFDNLQNCFNVTKASRQHYKNGIVLHTKAATILYNMNIITRVAQNTTADEKLFVWELPRKYNWLTTQDQTPMEQECLDHLVGADEEVENPNQFSCSSAMRWSKEAGHTDGEDIRFKRYKISHFVHTSTRGKKRKRHTASC